MARKVKAPPSNPDPVVRMQPGFEDEWEGASALAAECVLNTWVLADTIERESVRWAQARGLPSLSAFNVITVLEGADAPLRPSEISARMMVTRGTMTGILRTLAGHGLVTMERHAADGRAQLVSLTDKGRKVHSELMPRVHAAETRLMRVLSEDEMRQLLGLLARVQASAQDLSLPPAGVVTRRRPARGQV